MKKEFYFRGKKTWYSCEWIDGDTYVFKFKNDDFVNDFGEKYLIYFEYHSDDKEWIFSIWWICEYEEIVEERVDFNNCNYFDDYIKEVEIEEIKEFIKTLNNF